MTRVDASQPRLLTDWLALLGAAEHQQNRRHRADMARYVTRVALAVDGGFLAV